MPNPYQPDFWDSFEGDLWDDLAEVMIEIYLQGIDGGINALPKNIRVLADFDLVNVKALEFAKTYRYSLIKGIVDTTRTQTQTMVSDWIQSGAPLDALEKSLESVYGAARAERIAVTEATRTYATANADAWKSTGMVSKGRWNTAEDERVCVICLEKNGTEVDLDDPEQIPPAHVGDRCYITPIVDEEAVSALLDEALA